MTRRAIRIPRFVSFRGPRRSTSGVCSRWPHHPDTATGAPRIDLTLFTRRLRTASITCTRDGNRITVTLQIGALAYRAHRRHLAARMKRLRLDVSHARLARLDHVPVKGNPPLIRAESNACKLWLADDRPIVFRRRLLSLGGSAVITSTGAGQKLPRAPRGMPEALESLDSSVQAGELLLQDFNVLSLLR